MRQAADRKKTVLMARGFTDGPQSPAREESLKKLSGMGGVGGYLTCTSQGLQG